MPEHALSNNTINIHAFLCSLTFGEVSLSGLYFTSTILFCVCCNMQSSLALLNVSGNNLDSLHDLTPLKKLVTIISSENSLSSMKVFLNSLICICTNSGF